jgi:hypothetical protein
MSTSLSHLLSWVLCLEWSLGQTLGKRFVELMHGDRVEFCNLCVFMGKRALWGCIENISERLQFSPTLIVCQVKDNWVFNLIACTSFPRK